MYASKLAGRDQGNVAHRSFKFDVSIAFRIKHTDKTNAIRSSEAPEGFEPDDDSAIMEAGDGALRLRLSRLDRLDLVVGEAYRTAMAETAADMAARRFGAAARNLERILAWRPGSDEAAYVLGICEQTRGRNQAADQAWARVTPGSSFLQRAVLAQLRLFHDTGRLASAEQLVLDAAKDPRNDPTELLVLLVPIYSQIGRSDDAARLIEDRWTALKGRGEATPDESIKLVRLHIESTSKTPPVENIRAYLDQVGRLAPEDDRVWLGRATWRSKPRLMTRHGGGSMPVPGAGLMTFPSGVPGCVTASQAIAPTWCKTR